MKPHANNMHVHVQENILRKIMKIYAIAKFIGISTCIRHRCLYLSYKSFLQIASLQKLYTLAGSIWIASCQMQAARAFL